MPAPTPSEIINIQENDIRLLQHHVRQRDAEIEQLKAAIGTPEVYAGVVSAVLEEEIEQLKMEHNAILIKKDAKLARYCGQMAKQDNEIDRLTKDKKRLDWLERFFSVEDVDYNEHLGLTTWAWVIRCEELEECLGGSTNAEYRKTALREAIEAAREASE